MKKLVAVMSLCAIFFGSTSFCSNYRPDAACTGARIAMRVKIANTVSTVLKMAVLVVFVKNRM